MTVDEIVKVCAKSFKFLCEEEIVLHEGDSLSVKHIYIKNVEEDSCAQAKQSIIEACDEEQRIGSSSNQ